MKHVAQKPQQNKKFWCNIFTTKDEIVAAICDEELLGKVLNFQNTKVTISKQFYGGRVVDEDFVNRLMQKATIGNLFGEKIIEIAGKNGFIISENIILIDGIPHAQFVKLK